MQAGGEPGTRSRAGKARVKGSRLRLAAVAATLLLLLVLLPPLVNLNRYGADVAAALGRALDRQVSVGAVHLRLLPQPGFHLRRVIIQDDPAISAEPMLMAEEVTAALRLSSLWRGRLEIAHLSFHYPSVNLARSPAGGWNIESLLARASHVSSAPTDKLPEGRARFPYVEAQGGRINLKQGEEKLVYALNQADFSLWQSGEDEWSLRLRAVPVRTDTVISDTGTLRVTGSMRRAGAGRDARVRLRLAWDGAQLGQVTRLLYGRDRGWRGGVSASARVDGSPAALAMAVSASVSDFRRHDIVPADNMDLATRCTASFSALSGDLAGLQCRMPLGEGALSVRGDITSLARAPGHDLTFRAERLPMAALAALARRAKRDLAEDLTASGQMDGEFTWRRAAGQPRLAAQWEGGGTVSAVQLRSRLLRPALRVGQARFVLAAGGASSGVRAEPHLVLRPFAVPLGGELAATAEGWFSTSAYALHVRGESEAARALATARALGLTAAHLPASGGAQLDLRITGVWPDFPAPAVSGSARLRQVQAQVPGVAAPLVIAAGTLVLAPASVTLRDLAASPAGSETEFTGWARVPRGCGSLAECPVQFELRANRLASDELNALLNPRPLRRPWYEFARTRRGAASPMIQLRAAGRLLADEARIGGLHATHVAAQVEMADGVARFSDVRATVLGGRHRGRWEADFRGAQPAYSGEGRVQNASMNRLAGAAAEHWSDGTVDAAYTLNTAGTTTAELLSAAAGSVRFDWRDGELRPVVLPAAPAQSASAAPEPAASEPAVEALRVRSLRGTLQVAQGGLQLPSADLEAGDGRYRVFGEAAFDGTLQLQLIRDATHAYSVRGMWQAPQVLSLTSEQIQAALKE